MSNLNDLLVVMREHQKADRLIQGSWINDKDSDGIFRGCFYGCAMQTDDRAIESACGKYGMPLWMGYWSDRVFEGLPVNEAVLWPVQLLEPLVNFTGSYEDLRHNLAIKRLSYLSERNTGDVKKAIDGVIKYHQTRDESIRESVGSAARSEGELAGESEVESAEWSAAWSAVRSVWSAGESAAWSAARSAEWSARSASRLAQPAESAWRRERGWVLELLKE